YPAPQLLYPPDDARFEGRETAITLQWTSVGILTADEWYAVHLRYLGERSAGRPNEMVSYTHVTSWRLPQEWYPGTGASAVRFEWKVDVVRVQGEGSQPELISSSGFVRRFSWR
ncbi:MAG: hypothetical protein JXA09_14705, partial [Anaerolineae bacterium]|nr:hypothetical protein [Anaerolineae bacterium]